MLRAPDVSADAYPCFGPYRGHSDPVTGSLWLIAEGGTTFVRRQFWLVEGLPRTNAGSGGGCPAVPGDLAPVIRDPATTSPTAHAQGDGRVDVADAVLVLRASVGLDQIACGP